MSTEPLPDKDDPRWTCPACGGGGLEVLAWVDLETNDVIDWADPTDFWCPECEEHFETVCRVNRDSLCESHNQPFTECRAEYGATRDRTGDGTRGGGP